MMNDENVPNKLNDNWGWYVDIEIYKKNINKQGYNNTIKPHNKISSLKNILQPVKNNTKTKIKNNTKTNNKPIKHQVVEQQLINHDDINKFYMNNNNGSYNCLKYITIVGSIVLTSCIGVFNIFNIIKTIKR